MEDPRVTELQRQLEIEQQVKAGAEKLLQNYASHARHLQDEAKRALEESRDKIGIITNQLSRLHKELQMGAGDDKTGVRNGANAPRSETSGGSQLDVASIETRVAELKQRLVVERAMLQGASKAVKLLKNKNADKGAKQQVSSFFGENAQFVSTCTHRKHGT